MTQADDQPAADAPRLSPGLGRRWATSSASPSAPATSAPRNRPGPAPMTLTRIPSSEHDPADLARRPADRRHQRQLAGALEDGHGHRVRHADAADDQRDGDEQQDGLADQPAVGARAGSLVGVRDGVGGRRPRRGSSCRTSLVWASAATCTAMTVTSSGRWTRVWACLRSMIAPPSTKNCPAGRCRRRRTGACRSSSCRRPRRRAARPAGRRSRSRRGAPCGGRKRRPGGWRPGPRGSSRRPASRGRPEVVGQQHHRGGARDAGESADAVDHRHRQERGRGVLDAVLEDCEVGRAETDQLACGLLQPLAEREQPDDRRDAQGDPQRGEGGTARTPPQVREEDRDRPRGSSGSGRAKAPSGPPRTPEGTAISRRRRRAGVATRGGSGVDAPAA